MAFPEPAVLPQAKVRPGRIWRAGFGPDQQARSGRAGRAGFGTLPGGEGPMPCACVKLRGQAGFAVFSAPAPGRSDLPGLPVAHLPVRLSLLVLVHPYASLFALVRLAGKATRQERHAGKRIPVRVLFSALFPRPGTAPMPHAQRTLVRSARLPWRPGRSEGAAFRKATGKTGSGRADSCR